MIVPRLLPPLVITEAETDEALGRLDAALGAVTFDARNGRLTAYVTASAGDRVSELNAEMTVEMAMVSANWR